MSRISLDLSIGRAGKSAGIWEYYSQKVNLVGRKFFESQHTRQKFIYYMFMVFNIFHKINFILIKNHVFLLNNNKYLLQYDKFLPKNDAFWQTIF